MYRDNMIQLMLLSFLGAVFVISYLNAIVLHCGNIIALLWKKHGEKI